jgi:hypothetical protein
MSQRSDEMRQCEMVGMEWSNDEATCLLEKRLVNQAQFGTRPSGGLGEVDVHLKTSRQQ